MGLRNFFDKLREKSEKGQPLHFLRSTIDAFDTFFFVPNKVTTSGAHIRDAMDMKRAMGTVILALIPVLLFGMWNVGYQYHLSIGKHADLWTNFWFGFKKVFPLIVVSYLVGLGTEFISAQLKGEEVNEGFLVSGLLIPLVLPVGVPLWMVAVATFLAVLFGKEVFGGTGMNILNPALLTRAILFFAYPTKMSGTDVWIADITKNRGLVDGFTGATPLGDLATLSADQLSTFHQHYSIADMLIGTIPGSIGETSFIAIAIGAIILLYTGIASWKIMLSAFTGGALMAWFFNLVGGDSALMQLPFYEHLLLGGFAFGMVFMVTDPVTATQTETGKWWYGFLAGALAIMARVINPAYPEGVMLAILFMNVWAPLIDYIVMQNNIKRRLKRAVVLAK